MIVVVADASPIHYLVLVGHVDLLPRFFERVILPGNVRLELLHPSTPGEVSSWIQNPPSWLQIASAKELHDFGLDPGETEAIMLAQELNAFAVLLDDFAARTVAARKGLRIVGTLGILERAGIEGIVDFPKVIEALQKTNIHISSELLDAAVKRVKRRI